MRTHMSCIFKVCLFLLLALPLVACEGDPSVRIEDGPPSDGAAGMVAVTTQAVANQLQYQPRQDGQNANLQNLVHMRVATLRVGANTPTGIRSVDLRLSVSREQLVVATNSFTPPATPWIVRQVVNGVTTDISPSLYSVAFSGPPPYPNLPWFECDPLDRPDAARCYGLTFTFNGGGWYVQQGGDLQLLAAFTSGTGIPINDWISSRIHQVMGVNGVAAVSTINPPVPIFMRRIM